MAPAATQVLQGARPFLDPPPAAAQHAAPAAPAAPPQEADGPEFLAVPEVPAAEPPLPEAEPVIALDTAETPDAQDDVLRDIYTRETNAHVATVREYLRVEAPRPQPHVLSEAVYRACHTLSGRLHHGRGPSWHPPGATRRSLAAQVI